MSKHSSWIILGDSRVSMDVVVVCLQLLLSSFTSDRPVRDDFGNLTATSTSETETNRIVGGCPRGVEFEEHKRPGFDYNYYYYYCELLLLLRESARQHPRSGAASDEGDG
eukprot:CAMPEP_0194222054 /NCGR_PEP_ID=MMETSP0156-20130528/31993_1 /TAXON_ID=33649 /ORGANISM="Thalassionema nitzschioides, Strain L26-B" /LENGTH=109 /DNA_ID=CAMNT_0038952683 /DNA_START=81 /DNA_END=407 /DNA_ORIENTATION=+